MSPLNFWRDVRTVEVEIISVAPKQSQENAGGSMASVSSPDGMGVLYVVAVPIGHPNDLSRRALTIFKSVHLIAAEDPQQTQQLLAHHGISATVTSYGPVNVNEKVAVLLQRLQQGARIAIVADTGSPLVVDPGALLVAGAHAQGTRVIPIPGPSAAIAALTAAGFPCEAFYVLGQLPSTGPHLSRRVANAVNREVPTVAFGTQITVLRALKTIARLAPRRLVVAACDLTKPKEVILRGTARQVSQRLSDEQGEDITIVVSGKR
jgi:16S rRNA (cytidine1402-2'-O)-methyltransferase